MNKMIGRGLFLFPLLFIVMGNTGDKKTKGSSGVIIEGASVGAIDIGMKFRTADSLLQKRHQQINWANYSFEYRYKKLGMSLYVKIEDTSQTIFAIAVDPRNTT